jgi:hypothetical protein
VSDFLVSESAKLKDDEETFSTRRSKYPPRGAFQDYDMEAGGDDLSPFVKKAIEIDGGLTWTRPE